MSCPRTEPEVAAYLDGELDLAATLAFERHLEECADCARALAAGQALREAIGRAGLRHRPSPAQTRRLLQAVQTAQGGASGGAGGQRWPQTLAALLLVALASWSLGRFVPPRSPGSAPDLVEEVVAGHVRSLLAGHPSDVVSTDRHTVKPWFTGRLDYAPQVVDLAPRGFPLVGGRLDYQANHPVAALVYRSDRHVINLFTWPAAYTPDRSGPDPAAFTREGFHVLHWSRGGMTYWAVSDLEESRLRQLARLLEAEGARGAAGP